MHNFLNFPYEVLLITISNIINSSLKAPLKIENLDQNQFELKASLEVQVWQCLR